MPDTVVPLYVDYLFEFSETCCFFREGKEALKDCYLYNIF